MKNKKHIFILAIGVFLISFVSSCMKDTDKDFYFKKAIVEFDAATNVAKAAGKHYPLLAERARGFGKVSYQVNLLGEQISSAQTIAIRVISEDSNAVEGVHYSLPNGSNVVLEANSSIATFEVNILDFPAETGIATVVFEIVGNETVKPSENYKAIGVRINKK